MASNYYDESKPKDADQSFSLKQLFSSIGGSSKKSSKKSSNQLYNEGTPDTKASRVRKSSKSNKKSTGKKSSLVRSSTPRNLFPSNDQFPRVFENEGHLPELDFSRSSDSRRISPLEKNRSNLAEVKSTSNNNVFKNLTKYWEGRLAPKKICDVWSSEDLRNRRSSSSTAEWTVGRGRLGSKKSDSSEIMSSANVGIKKKDQHKRKSEKWEDRYNETICFEKLALTDTDAGLQEQGARPREYLYAGQQEQGARPREYLHAGQQEQGARPREYLHAGQQEQGVRPRNELNAGGKKNKGASSHKRMEEGPQGRGARPLELSFIDELKGALRRREVHKSQLQGTFHREDVYEDEMDETPHREDELQGTISRKNLNEDGMLRTVFRKFIYEDGKQGEARSTENLRKDQDQKEIFRREKLDYDHEQNRTPSRERLYAENYSSKPNDHRSPNECVAPWDNSKTMTINSSYSQSTEKTRKRRLSRNKRTASSRRGKSLAGDGSSDKSYVRKLTRKAADSIRRLNSRHEKLKRLNFLIDVSNLPNCPPVLHAVIDTTVKDVLRSWGYEDDETSWNLSAFDCIYGLENSVVANEVSVAGARNQSLQRGSIEKLFAAALSDKSDGKKK